MTNNRKFIVEYLEEAATFLKSIDEKAAKKLLQVIEVASYTNDPKKFKKLVGTNIWEFRAEVNKLQYRLFAFWDHDKQTIVIATHGMIKKTQKTPTAEIAKAERLRKQYLEDKEDKK